MKQRCANYVHIRSIVQSFLIGLLFVPSMCYAGNVVKYLSNVNGLTNNSVNCIFEDSQHIVWIGTWDGLNAYNGRDIKTFRYNKNNKQSISNNIIRQIVEQDSSYLWVATDYGINRWDRRLQKFTSYFLGAEHQAPKQEKSFLLGLTSNSRIVCFVKGQGLFYFDNTQFKSIQIDFTGEIKDFVIDNEDNIYFLSQSGELRYGKIKEGVDKSLNISGMQTLVHKSPIEKIFFTGNRLILTFQNSLEVLNKSHTTIRKIDLDKGKSLSDVICNRDILYISFYEGGCFKFDLTTNILSQLSDIPERISVFTMYMGSQDILWIGSDGQGVLMLYEHNSPFTSVYTNHPVRSFCQDKDGNILVGTKGDGIKLFDRQTKLLSNYLSVDNGLISNSVYAIKKNNANDIFIGTEGVGINVLYAQNNRLERLNIPLKHPVFRAVYSIHFSNHDSVLWLGTSGYGLIKIELSKENNAYIAKNVEQYVSTNQRKSLNNDVIYTIVPSADENKLWFGTRGGGVNMIDVNTGKIKQLDDIYDHVSLTDNDVLCLHYNSKDLWVGTSYGLNRLVYDGENVSLKQYTDNEGLNSNTIHGILEDENKNIWISTNLGISHLNLENNSIENYTLKDGLQSDEFSDGAYFKDKTNLLYFGGTNGFSYFRPENIRLRDFSTTLSLSELKIYNTVQNIYERVNDGVLKLSYDERYATLTFIAKDFINNENCEYKYRLLNFSDEWINNGNNPNVVFTKLPPGKYLLEVRYTNGDKIWSDDVYQLQIHVAYPWWLSVPAVVAYIILLLIALYITQSVIKNRIRLNRQILLEKIEKQHQQKIHESKLNFFTNVAHEFFTPLTLIYGPAQHLLESANLDNYTKRYIQIIKNNAERMQKLISELMEFRKAKTGHTPLHPESIDINLLIDYVSDNYLEMAEQNKIDYQINSNNISTVFTDRDSLEKIFFNLFSNAFKYTPRNGYIHIDIWQDAAQNNSLSLVIRNSGTGLTDQQMAEIFNKYKIFDTPKLDNTLSTGIGLNLTKSLTELLGGTIEVSSNYGEYVEFRLNIPSLQTSASNIISNKQDVEESVASSNASQIQNKDIRILIVEDEKNIRELLKDILEPIYTIIEAEDGQEALDIIAKSHPDIIVSDVLMPNLDGMSLIDRLKENPQTVYIPIISISAKNSIEDHIAAYKHGADLYITKPFHPRHVLSTIENLITKQDTLKRYFNSSISSVKIKDGLAIHQDDEKLVQDVISFIQKSIDDESLSPNTIAEFMAISKATLYRKLKDITDKTPSEFVRTIRLEYASKLLITTKLTVLEIMFKSGFTNKSYFYREFAKQYGLSPKEFRNKSENN